MYKQLTTHVCFLPIMCGFLHTLEKLLPYGGFFQLLRRAASFGCKQWGPFFRYFFSEILFLELFLSDFFPPELFFFGMSLHDLA